jgi:4-amino-4-deoxy-L-arabinose transferase
MKTRAVIALAALFALAYLLPLGARPFFQPDEFRYAEIPREMLASGDWVTPRLNGLRYFEKPPLGYWLTALSMSCFGENRFAARLPSALSAGGTVLLLFLLVRRFGGGFRVAALAAGLLLTSGLFFVLGCFNVLDMPLTFFLTLALFAFFRAYMAECRRAKLLWLGLFGAASGAAFLVKGFLAFAVPGLVIVSFMLWQRSTGRLLRWAWAPALTGLLVALPWAILVHRHEPDYWRYFVVVEHLQRFMGKSAQHAEPFWFYIPVLLGGFAPWLFFLPAAWKGYRREDLRDPFLRFALCWLVLPFLFFSASKGKLGTYVLPLMPALAALAALGLARYLGAGTGDGERETDTAGGGCAAAKSQYGLYRGAAWVLAALLALTAIALVGVQLAGFKFAPYGAGEQWKWLCASAALLLWAVTIVLVSRDDDPLRGAFLLCLVPCAVLMMSHGLLPRLAENFRAPGRMLETFRAGVLPGMPLGADPGSLHAVCWTYKRADVIVLRTPGEVAYGLQQPEGRGRQISIDELARLIAGRPGEIITVMLDRERFARGEAERLPKPVFSETRGGFIFLQFSGGSVVPPSKPKETP